MYADRDTVIADFLPEAKTAAERASVERMIESVSRAIDKFTRRPDGYFAPAAATATPRVCCGEGQNYLRLPVHVEGSIDRETGVEVGGHPITNWVELNGWLYQTYRLGTLGGVWVAGTRYTVHARWGYAETPADIRLACGMWVQHLWERQRGAIGSVTPNGFVVERDMPPPVKTMLSEHRRRAYEVR